MTFPDFDERLESRCVITGVVRPLAGATSRHARRFSTHAILRTTDGTYARMFMVRMAIIRRERFVKQYEFKLALFDRIGLRSEGSEALEKLDALGAKGWHIVHVREDVQHARDIVVFLEREIPSPT